MKLLHLVRHGESASNAGLPTESPVTNPITALGREQAHRFALAWGEPGPDLIVTSHYIRTQQTADPLRQRFANAPYETWGVHEWTQLTPSKYRGTTNAERRPKVMAYYDRKDPNFCDGAGAESFVDLFRRVGQALDRAAQREEATIVMFTHGHFMRAVIWSILSDRLPSTPEAMERFLLFSEALDVPNLAMLTLRSQNEWAVGGPWLVGKMWRLREGSG